MSDAASIQAGRAIGAMFFAFFGTGWLVWWCLEAYGAELPILAFIATGGVGLFFLSLRQFRHHRSAMAPQKTSPARKKIARIFTAINILQWLLIIVVVNILANIGRPEWSVAAIIFIVGLHFLPLAAVFTYRWHYVTGSALILLSITYPFVSSAGPASPSGLLGTGIILWISTFVALTASVASQNECFTQWPG